MKKNLFQFGLLVLRVWLAAAATSTLVLFLFVSGVQKNNAIALIPEIVGVTIMVALLTTATYFVLVQRTELACMTGMMVGMTLGMIAGFTIGYLVGATNGMFVGSVVGVMVGMFVGARAGRCCGIMGVMEGMMAGLMAGTMGPMLSVMLIADHLRAFTILFLLAAAAIIFALVELVTREFSAMGRSSSHGLIRGEQGAIMLVAASASILLSLFMVLGPRGPITILTGNI